MPVYQSGLVYNRPKNFLLNGNLDVWQRGTSIVTPTHRRHLADRILFGQDGGTPATAATWTVDRDTDVPDSSVNYSLRISCTTTDTSVGAGEETHIRYGIEGSDFIPFVGQLATLSFWVKSNKTGTYCVAFTNNVRDRTYLTEYTINASDTWEQKIITINFNYTGGTWNYTNELGIGIRFALRCGSTWQGTNNTWNNANVVATANQVNLADSASNVIRFAKMSLCLTPNYIEPVKPDLSSVIEHCRRYMIAWSATTGGVNMLAIAGGDANSTNIDLALSSPMRIAPAISADGTIGTDYDLQNPSTGALLGITSITSFARSPYYIKFTANKTASFSPGQLNYFRLVTTSGRLIADAEL